MPGPTALPRSQPTTVGPAQLAQQEVAGLDGGAQQFVVVGRGRRFGQRGQEQRVPLGEDLVVEAGAHTFFPCFEEALAGALDVWRTDEVAAHGAVEDVGALEVAGLGDAPPLEGGGRLVGAEDIFDLIRAPDVELALLAFGVGVLR